MDNDQWTQISKCAPSDTSRLTFMKEEEGETPRSVVTSQLIDTATVTFFAGTPNSNGSTHSLWQCFPLGDRVRQQLEDEVEGEFVLFCLDWELALIPSISG